MTGAARMAEYPKQTEDLHARVLVAYRAILAPVHRSGTQLTEQRIFVGIIFLEVKVSLAGRQRQNLLERQDRCRRTGPTRPLRTSSSVMQWQCAGRIHRTRRRSSPPCADRRPPRIVLCCVSDCKSLSRAASQPQNWSDRRHCRGC